MFEQNAFAATAAADDDDGLAFLDFERDDIENFLGAEAHSQIARFDHGASQRPTDMVRKKLLIKMQMEEATTASVVALPTPSAPCGQLRPLKELIEAMMAPFYPRLA